MAVFVAAAVVPMGLLGIVFYTSSIRSVAEMVGNRTARLAQQVRSELDQKLEMRIQDRLVATNEPVQAFLAGVRDRNHPRSGATLAALRGYLATLFIQYGDYYDEIVLADVHGRPLLRYDRSGATIVPAQPPVASPLGPSLPGAPTPAPAEGARPPGRGVLTAIEPRFDELDRTLFEAGLALSADAHRLHVDPVEGGRAPTVSIIRPVFSNRQPEERLGYVLTRVRSEHLWPGEWAIQKFGERGHLAVIEARTGEVLYHTRAAWVGRSLKQVDPELSGAATATAPAGTAARPWVGVHGPEGERVGTFLDVEHAPWKVAVTAVPGEFEHEARRAALFNLVVATLALLTAATLLVYASGRLARSIHSLTAGARRIAGGDFAGPPILAETHDEIETLADAFNVMTASVRRNIEMREQAAAELDALNRSLETRVRERTRELEALNAALNQANEELKELDRLKSNFLATVSHEFKTPLTSIKAFAEILHDELEEQEVSDELRRFLRIIDSESDRLARLIKNVLDLSRIESGRMVWRMTDFPVSSVIEATIDGLLPALKEKHIRLERDVRCGPVRIHGDPDRVQEVIANVLDNAIKASAAGQRIVVGCSEAAERRDGEQRMLRVFIRDEGHGIPADQIEQIFDRFHQVTDRGRRRKGGTGLGLAICREITEHHGGRIWAESQVGGGSTFHITLPIATAPGAPRPDPGGSPHGGGETPGDPAHG